MEYSRFVNEITNLDFIGSTDKADAVIKAILGILASSMDDDHARKLTGKLPEPLTFEKLRGHQAKTAVDTVFRLCKEAVGEDTISEIEYDMPPDVAEELEAA